jgi:hypothetical protein
VQRREGQKIARAAHWFCASSEITGVLAGKGLCCISPGQLDVIRYELAVDRLHWRKRFGAGKGAKELKIIFESRGQAELAR